MKRTLPLLALVFAVGSLLLSLSCAKRGYPPGGPEDTIPPYVTAVSPPSGSIRVPDDSRISIQFSEAMKKRTVETGIIVSPPCRWEKRYWKGDTYVLIPKLPLRLLTTYLVSVSNKVMDAHGVAMGATFVSGFSTGDSIYAGIISGTIEWKRAGVEGAVVQIFDEASMDTVGGFRSLEPQYVTLSGKAGLYRIPFVNTDIDYSVIAFIDKDTDSEYDEGEEVGCYDSVVTFGETPELTNIDVTICGENLRGTIEGRIDTASVADTLAISVLATSVADTAVTYHAVPEESGGFLIECVIPGQYHLVAFADFNGNRWKDPEDTVFVELKDTLGVNSCSKSSPVEMIFNHDD